MKLERKRRNELRTKKDQIEEKTIEADEKRAQVKKDLEKRDNKAFDEYRKDLRAKRERNKQRFASEQSDIAQKAREDLQKLSENREKTMKFLEDERRIDQRETQRILKETEWKLLSG